jgi:ParB family chromosome partitioning protein
MQPICVQQLGTAAKPRYTVVFGFRRFAALQSIQAETVPCIVEPKSTSKGAIALKNVMENVARQQLNTVDEAEAAQRLLDLGVTQEEITTSLGWTKTYLTRTLRINALTDRLKEALREGSLSATQSIEIAKVPESYHERLIELASETSINALRAEVSAILARESGELVLAGEEDDEEPVSVEAAEDDLIATDILVNTVSEALAEFVALAYKDTAEQAANLRRLNEVKWDRLDYTHLAGFAAIISDMAGLLAGRR